MCPSCCEVQLYWSPMVTPPTACHFMYTAWLGCLLCCNVCSSECQTTCIRVRSMNLENNSSKTKNPPPDFGYNVPKILGLFAQALQTWCRWDYARPFTVCLGKNSENFVEISTVIHSLFHQKTWPSTQVTGKVHRPYGEGNLKFWVKVFFWFSGMEHMKLHRNGNFSNGIKLELPKWCRWR